MGSILGPPNFWKLTSCPNMYPISMAPLCPSTDKNSATLPERLPGIDANLRIQTRNMRLARNHLVKPNESTDYRGLIDFQYPDSCTSNI